jgi:hypothetical protein
MSEASELYDEAGGAAAGRQAGSGFVTGLVIGALVGAGVAMLLAPENGPAMRRRVGRGLRRVRDAADHELARRPRGRRGRRARGREAALQARLRSILDELL